MDYCAILILLACLLQIGQSRPSYKEAQSSHAPVGYHGPLARTVVLKSGHLADTPEVSAAKHLHYAALEKAKAEAAAHGYEGDDGSYGSHGGYVGSYSSGAGFGDISSGYGGGYNPYVSGGYGSSYGYDGNQAPVGYDGPLAKVVLLKSGHIADTPEVSAAKHSHYDALEKAHAAAVSHGYGGRDRFYGSYGGYGSSYSSGDGYDNSYTSGFTSGSGYAGSYQYSGPLAYPKVLPSGLLADTHEVSAARHAHLNAFAITSSEHAQKWANNNNQY